MSAPSIAAQAVAVERALLSVRGHRDVIAGLVAKGKRPAHELITLDRWLADLAPAAATMQRLARREPAPAHVPAKWMPVRRQEHAPRKEPGACSDSAGTEHAPGMALNRPRPGRAP